MAESFVYVPNTLCQQNQKTGPAICFALFCCKVCLGLSLHNAAVAIKPNQQYTQIPATKPFTRLDGSAG